METLSGSAPRTETRAYDAFDRLERVVDVEGRELNYAYDANGNRTRLTNSAGGTVRQTDWAYDRLNRNVSMTAAGQGTTSLDYFPSGLLHTVTRPTGATSQTEYDAAGRIATITHANAGSPVATIKYRYDLNGNRIEQKDTNGAVTGNAEQTTSYAHDLADRLTATHETEPGLSGTRDTAYTLDPVGNRTRETVTNPQGSVVSDSTLSYNPRDQLTQRDDPVANVHVSLTYDLDGNTKTDSVAGTPTRTFGYDARDRLVTLAQPGAPPLDFDYSPSDLRLRKTQASAETRYQYDQTSLLTETNAIGNPTARYFYSATQLLSRSDEGGSPTQRHYLLDALQTPIALLTQAGAIDSRTRFDAWGEVIAQQGTTGQLTTPNRDTAIATLPQSDDQPIGYTGYLKDQESGLYYAKARYYNPAIARFTSEDLEAGQALTPPSLHRYLYAYANPTVWTDPTGRQSVDSPRYALQQSVSLASNDRDRAIATAMLNDYDSEFARRADPTATGIANSVIHGTQGLAQLAADVLYTIPEAVLPESLNLNSRIRLGAFFTAIQNPVDMIATSDRELRYEAAQLRKAGNEFGAAAKIAEANTNVIGLLLGGRALLKSSINLTSTTIAKVANRGTALTIAEGANGGPALMFDSPAVASELKSGFARGGHERVPAPLPAQQFALLGAESRPRLPRDITVSPLAPAALPTQGRGIGTSPWQARTLMQDIADANASRAVDIRVDQQQVNAAGQRVGVNRPDLQYTRPDGTRVYIEYDRIDLQSFPNSPRGPGHMERLLANDPDGVVILRTNKQ